jgi:anti-anti-sigma regulatory factor
VETTRSQNLIVEAPAPGIRVVRFLRPDLRAHLDESGDGGALLRELCEGALDDLAPGEGVVLNLGLVECFPSTFLDLLLRVRQAVRARRGRLVLCGLRDEPWGVLRVTQTLKLFPVASGEAQAVFALTNGSDVPDHSRPPPA